MSSPAGHSIEVHSAGGETLAFKPDRIVLPAGARASIVFRNMSSLPHNLIFVTPLEFGTRPVLGPGEVDVIEFVAPAPGTYRFVCTIHEHMSGALETH